MEYKDVIPNRALRKFGAICMHDTYLQQNQEVQQKILSIANKGPIPEGTYYANQDQRQSLTFKNIALKKARRLVLFFYVITIKLRQIQFLGQ